MHRAGKRHASARRVNGIEHCAHGGRLRCGSRQKARGDLCGEAVSVALQGEQHGAGDDRQREPDQDEPIERSRERRRRSALAHNGEAERDEGDLGEQLRGHIDDGRGKGEGRGHALQDGRARAERDAADAARRARGRWPPRAPVSPRRTPRNTAAAARQQHEPRCRQEQGHREAIQAQQAESAEADATHGGEDRAKPDVNDDVESEAEP